MDSYVTLHYRLNDYLLLRRENNYIRFLWERTKDFFSANKSNFLEDLTKLSGNVVSGVCIKFTNHYIGDRIFVGIAHVCAR